MNEAARKTAWVLELELLDALDELDAMEGDDIPESLAAVVFDCMEAAVEKRDALAGAMKRRQAEIAALYERAADAEKKAERATKSLERLNAYILSILDLQGKKQLQGEQYKIGWRRNPDRVEVEPEFLVYHDTTSKYVRLITATVEADKRAIAEALKQGETVPGAKLVEGARRVVVT